MAQDATGTPTGLGIPKYNTAADAPSGKGFNAAMDAIDALLVARSFPTGVTNGPVYWNGSAWVSAKLQSPQLDLNEITPFIIPPGTICATARSTAPSGWELCQGQELNRTTYSALFGAIGTAYGVGDGSSTFNVPNLKGRVPVGYDSGQVEFDGLAETGGAKTHTLSTGEMPAHGHSISGTIYQPRVGGVLNGFANDYFAIGGYTAVDGWAGGSFASYGYAADNTGGGGAHNNLPPYQVVNWMVKT